MNCLQLMFNARRASGAESLVIEGDGWRSRLRGVGDHPGGKCSTVIRGSPSCRWPPPPLSAPTHCTSSNGPLEVLDGTGLAESQKIRAIGLISSYTLSEGQDGERRGPPRRGGPR